MCCVLKCDGTKSIHEGDFDGTRINELINSTYFQMVPIPDKNLQIWVDEEGMETKAINSIASGVFASYLAYPTLYGDVMVVREGVVE